MRVKWEKNASVSNVCLDFYSSDQKGYTHASCYFRYLIFLTTELQLAVFKLPAAVPEKLNRYKAFMSLILTTCSSPVRVRFSANGKSCKKNHCLPFVRLVQLVNVKYARMK